MDVMFWNINMFPDAWDVCVCVCALVPWMWPLSCFPVGAPPNRRGRGGGNRGRGRFNVRRDGPVKFEEDFDFETANAQFNKDEIDKELQSKLKLKGRVSSLLLHTL